MWGKKTLYNAIKLRKKDKYKNTSIKVYRKKCERLTRK